MEHMRNVCARGKKVDSFCIVFIDVQQFFSHKALKDFNLVQFEDTI